MTRRFAKFLKESQILSEIIKLIEKLINLSNKEQNSAKNQYFYSINFKNLKIE